MDMKKVLVNFEIPNFTPDQYDKVWDELRRTGHESPQGLITHAGAQSDRAFVVFDVWESEEAFREFGKTLMPLLTKHGVTQVQPRILPLRYMYNGKTKVMS